MEIESYILENPKLSPQSQKTYTRNYNKLIDLLNEEELNDIPQKDIINVIEKLENANSKIMLVNVAMNVKAHFNNRIDLLKKHREKLKQEINQNKNVKKDVKKNNVPTYNELQRYLNSLYLDANWRGYIINYLLINFNVRNKDLDLIIVNNVNDYKAMGLKGDENVIYVGSKNIYVRNNYKTVKQYGQKKNSFNSRKFGVAVKSFFNDQNPEDNIVYLLSDKNGNRISGDSLGNYIKKYTLNKMSESDYNKISVSRVKDMDDYPLLEKISKNRGTSIETLISEYNLNIKLTE